jgi:hypothetical protein
MQKQKECVGLAYWKANSFKLALGTTSHQGTLGVVLHCYAGGCVHGTPPIGLSFALVVRFFLSEPRARFRVVQREAAPRVPKCLG